MEHSLLRRGVLEGIRTPGLLVRSQTLYPAELQAHRLTKEVSFIIIQTNYRYGKPFSSFYYTKRLNNCLLLLMTV